MQPDERPASTPTSSPTFGSSYPMTEQRQFTDYMSEAGGKIYSGSSKAVTYFVDHPLITGSIIVGGIGAFVGSRIAYVIAERRKKTTYDRAMETVGLFVDTISSALSPKNRERAIKQVSLAGKDVLGYGQSLGTTVAERVPLDKIRQMDYLSDEEKPSTIRQVGYGLSLIPVTLALVRNPLVRAVAFRFLAGRIRPRRKR